MKLKYNENGQTLVTLLFFIIIALTITTAAIIMMALGSRDTTRVQEGSLAYYIAESGAENALIRLLRDPNYVGETLLVDSGKATVQVSGTNQKTIISKGELGNFSRTIKISAAYVNNNILTVQSWKEIFN